MLDKLNYALLMTAGPFLAMGLPPLFLEMVARGIVPVWVMALLYYGTSGCIGYLIWDIARDMPRRKTDTIEKELIDDEIN